MVCCYKALQGLWRLGDLFFLPVKIKNFTDWRQNNHITWLFSAYLAGPVRGTLFSWCMCVGGGEPAEPWPGENKGNWSRKCHFLTQPDLDQKESVRSTNRKESTLKRAEQLTITSAIKRETSRCVTLFRNVERSSTLHMLLVDAGPWRRLVLCLVIRNYGYDSLQMAINYPWMMILYTSIHAVLYISAWGDVKNMVGDVMT